VNRYSVLVLSKGATVLECQDCGAVVFHRTIHDAWHAVNEREAQAVAALLARLVQQAGGDAVAVVDEVEAAAVEVEVAYLDAYHQAQLTAHRAIREYRSDARRN